MRGRLSTAFTPPPSPSPLPGRERDGGGTHIEREVPLAGLTSIGFGGPAEFLARPASPEEARALVAEAGRSGMPLHVIGGGTNLFVNDAGVAGLVMAIGPGWMNEVRVEGRHIVAGAGAPLSRAVQVAIDNGLAGLEPLVGIPGSVGGAVRMNAGSRHGEIGAVTAAVTGIDPTGCPVHLESRQCGFAYRGSALDGAVIVEAQFDLSPVDREDLKRRAQEICRQRKATQPMGMRSAGCVFKNPPGQCAGRLIDQAGLKGARIGGMEVSQKHANFFVNTGGATFDDARRLIDLVRDAVRRAFGVELELEVQIW